MNKKGQIVGVIVAITVVVIVAMVALQVIFSQVDEQTLQTAITADQFTAANATCVRVTSTENCYESGSSALTNSSNGVPSDGNFSECGDSGGFFGFSLNANGADSSLDGVVQNASYTQQSCNFIDSGITRTVILNYSILFAIAILVFIAGFVIFRQ